MVPPSRSSVPESGASILVRMRAPRPRARAWLLLIVVTVVPTGGCGLLGVLTHTGGIVVCNDTEADVIDSVEVRAVNCPTWYQEDPPPGSCEESSEDDLHPGDCADFSVLALGNWNVFVTWSDGGTNWFEVRVEEGSATALDVGR